MLFIIIGQSGTHESAGPAGSLAVQFPPKRFQLRRKAVDFLHRDRVVPYALVAERLEDQADGEEPGNVLDRNSTLGKHSIEIIPGRPERR